MKITKLGTIKYERIWIGTCSSCHSEAEALESEMTNITYGGLFRDQGPFSYETCPVCGGRKYNGMIFRPGLT